MNDSVPVKTAKTTLEFVEVVAALDGATFAEITEAVDMPKSTAYDYLQTLLQTGYLIEENGEYVISTKFLELGESRRQRMKIFQSAKPEIEQLAEETGEHASLMIEENGLGVLLYIATGENALQLDAYGGQRFPLSTTAPGKAILAHLPRDQVDRIVEEHGMPPVTANTITDRETLYEELGSIRDLGYATDLQERIDGVNAVSAPILSKGQIQGAITVGGPAHRIVGDVLEEELPSMLLRTANVIQVNITYS
ncbi:IclR family transcriptional regulator [Natrialbaceae archaeon A-CW1-1]